jgi:hypothetical protein
MPVLFGSNGASEDAYYHWRMQLLPRTAASRFRAEAKSRLKGGCRQDCLPT